MSSMQPGDEKDLLAQALRERSEGIGGHPIGMADVRGRARTLRRRRNAVRGVVAALVAAVVVPSGIAITDALSTPDGPTPAQVAGQPPQGEESTPAPQPRADGTFPLTMEGLRRGPEPQASYVVGPRRQLVTPDATLDLPQAYLQVVPYADGWLALAASEGGGVEAQKLSRDFEVLDASPSGGSLVLDEDGTHAAYTDLSGGTTTLVSAPTAGGRPVTWRLPYAPNLDARPIGYLGRDTVLVQTLAGGSPAVSIARPGGGLEQVDRFLSVRGASESTGLVSGQLTYDPLGGSCYGVVDALSDPGRLLWKTCRTALGDFSPDGQFVLGFTNDADGLGSPTLSILDARNGKVLTTFSADRDAPFAVQQTVWEDSRSVLATVTDGRKETMVRAGVDGSLEQVSDIFPGGMDVSLWFAGVPRS
ncbi:hypothetical protein [Nocardioides mesophilus]|uniref:WD40 repeat domain-containing protein n=1 Tax=Nocardioides mesophilus TaxID=433659 RepID=A0A7G9R785_9ACTN|nr:hypothetical protein [Nocardioides mesophilus]QNN51460.1 hypothetical protein H9L09_12705 [Nocardioides mesophilus]